MTTSEFKQSKSHSQLDLLKSVHENQSTLTLPLNHGGVPSQVPRFLTCDSSYTNNSSEEEFYLETPFRVAPSVLSKRNREREERAHIMRNLDIFNYASSNGIARSRSVSSQMCPCPGPLPHANLVTHSGIILLRITKGIFRKQSFVEHHWIKYGAHCLLLFKSTRDMQQWFSDPTLCGDERNQLVANRLDFNEELIHRSPYTILGYKSTAKYSKTYRKYGQL